MGVVVVEMATKIYNKYEVDDRGYSFTAPYNAPEGFSENRCGVCEYPVKGEGVFATGVKIVYEKDEPLDESGVTLGYDHEYQPYEMECLKNLWMKCGNCGWNQYS